MFRGDMPLAQCLIEAIKLGCRIEDVPDEPTKKRLWIPGRATPIHFGKVSHRAPAFLTRELIRWQTGLELAKGLPDRSSISMPKVTSAPRPNITGSDVPGFAAKLETISPETAREWIAVTESNGDHNRNLSDLRVDSHARTIQEGKWDPYNGETFKLAADGSVLDGQHRLWGIAFAGISVKALVVRGVPKTSFATIDVGMPRSASTVIHLAGEASATAAAAVARLLYLIRASRTLESGIRPMARRIYLPPNQILEILRANPKITESIRVAQRTRQGGLAVIPITATAAAYFCCAQVAPTQAEAFFAVELPGRKTEQAPNDPARRLRETFTNARIRRTSIDSELALAYIFKAWNAYRKGEPCHLLSWRVEQENFPTIEGGDRVVIA